MSKKKNKKVADDGSEKKNSEVVNEKQNEVDISGKDNPKSEEGQKKKKDNNGGGGGGILLKTELHCEGCASKVGKFLRGFPGVEDVNFEGSGKIKVLGKVDPVELREKLEQKTHKKVELLMPVPKKDNSENSKGKDGGDTKNTDGKGDKKKEDNKKAGKDDKNSKQAPVTTAVMKVSLHCEGCIHKIYKLISNTKGFEEMKVDKQKDLVTVKGSMDMKALTEDLKKHLKRDVEIVPAKKEDKKEKGNGNEGGGGNGSKKAMATDNGGGGGDGGEDKMEGNKMQVQQFGFGMVAPPQQQPAYGYPSPSPSYMYGGEPYNQFPYYHAPQMFSDENPNACSIM